MPSWQHTSYTVRVGVLQSFRAMSSQSITEEELIALRNGLKKSNPNRVRRVLDGIWARNLLK